MNNMNNMNNMNTILGGLRIGLQGREALPNEDQCPACKFFVLTPEVLRIIGERTNPSISPSNAECRCKQRDRSDGIIRQRLSNMPNYHDPKTFDNFEPRPGTEDALAASRFFVSGEMPEKMLVLKGDPGTGKSHLIEAALRWALPQKISVRYEYVPDLLQELRATFNSDAPESTTQRLFAIDSPSILALDDIGAQKSSEWVSEQLTMMVENRIQSGKRLIVATNQNYNEMANSIGDRIADRLFARNSRLVKIVLLQCSSYRTGE